MHFDEHPNAVLVRQLYASLAAKDGNAMAACYAADATFSDPVFPHLHGGDVGDMWRMLTSRSGELRLEVSDVQADHDKGTAVWDAWYTFSQTGRKVHNHGVAKFTFKDGRIASHVDAWDFRAWAAQALGASGRLLGWTNFLMVKVQDRARAGLRKFQASL